jgi:type IV secretory pathway VirJ component
MILPTLLAALAAVPSTVSVPGFGEVPVDSPTGAPRTFVILLTGKSDAAGAAALGRSLAEDGALTLRVDVDAHLGRAKGRRCLYLAGDLESLAQAAQKVLGLPEYLRPVLVGHGLGASAAWASVAEAPAGTFRGAVLGGLCPERPIPSVICKGGKPVARAVAGGEVVPPGPASAPVVVVGGAQDADCPPAGARAFAAAVPGAVFREAPAAGARLDAGWTEALRAAAAELPPSAPMPAGSTQAFADSVRDLPLVEVPSGKPGTRMAVLLTGDGGWAGLDRGLAAALAEAGVPVVGLDSLKYFWKRRTPEETAEAIGRIVRHYRAAWGRDEVLLVGYSRGADLVSFLPPRMPEEVGAAVRLVAMLGPGTFAEFEVHAMDLLSGVHRKAALPTEEAVAALGDLPVLCIQGADESDTLCPKIAGRPNVRRWVLPGGHHFDRDYGKLAHLVLDAAGPSSAAK